MMGRRICTLALRFGGRSERRGRLLRMGVRGGNAHVDASIGIELTLIDLTEDDYAGKLGVRVIGHGWVE